MRGREIDDFIVQECLCIRKRLAEVFFFEFRVLTKQALAIGIGAERFKDAPDCDAQPANACLASEARRIGRDAVEDHCSMKL